MNLFCKKSGTSQMMTARSLKFQKFATSLSKLCLKQGSFLECFNVLGDHPVQSLLRTTHCSPRDRDFSVATDSPSATFPARWVVPDPT
jgi:hypothetical protein